MAGNIQSVSIAKIGERFAQYVIKVRSIKTDLVDVYQGISSLRNNWTGKRMNAIIEKYNSVSKNLVTNFNFFGKTVVNSLSEILAQYEHMENQGVAIDLHDQSDVTIEEISATIGLTSTENVKFEQEKVTSTVTAIEGNLTTLESKLTSLVNMLDDLKSDSDSLNKLVTNYNAVAESMIGNLTQIKESLKTEIDNAVKVVQTTEGYNDNDASRVQGGQASE